MKPKKQRPLYQTIRSILGGIVFIYCYIFVFRDTPFSFAISLFYTLLCLIIIFLLVKPRKRDAIDIHFTNKEQRDAMKQLLDEGKKNLNHIEDLRRSLPYDSVKKQISITINTAMEMITYLQNNPSKIKVARKFFTYYIPTFETLVTKYTELSNQNIQTPEIIQAKRNISQTLDLLNPSFKRQFGNLMENEILDLDAEIAVLKSTIQLEE